MEDVDELLDDDELYEELDNELYVELDNELYEELDDECRDAFRSRNHAEAVRLLPCRRYP